jgi:hypothetical protein
VFQNSGSPDNARVVLLELLLSVPLSAGRSDLWKPPHSTSSSWLNRQQCSKCSVPVNQHSRW